MKMNKKMGDTCQHLRVYEDEKEGESICIDCALVLDRLCGIPKYPPPREELQMTGENERILDYIKDICANGCFPQNVVQCAFNYFVKIKKEISTRFFLNDALAAFAVYNALNELDIPRSIDEVERYSGVTVKKMWEIAGCLNITNVPNDPTVYVDYYCSLLPLQYFDANIIRSIVGNLYGMGNIRPNGLIAAIIRLYCIENNRKEIKFSDICRATKTKRAGIHRIIRLLDEKYIKQITLLSSK